MADASFCHILLLSGADTAPRPELKTLKNHTEHVVLKPMVVKPAMVQEQEPVGLELTEEARREHFSDLITATQEENL